MQVYVLSITDRFNRTTVTTYRTESAARIASLELGEIGDTMSLYRTWLSD